MNPSSLSVGFIGLGVMGKLMAHNLLKAGFPLTVHNRTAGKAGDLVSAGAKEAASPSEVARASDVIFTCLPDTPDVESVLFGPDGVAGGARAGSVVIDCSTISATATTSFAQRLKAQDIDLIDSPVSGGPKGAEAGTLSCMLGGDAGVIERCMPAFKAIGKTFVHVGPVGAGQIVKACNQLVICATLMGVSEAVALCKKAGLDPAKMREALAGGAANSFVLQNHAVRLLAGNLQPGFRSALMLKDMKLASSLGRDVGAFLPITALSTQFLGVLNETERGGLDCAAVGLVFQELSGLPGSGT